MMNTHKKKLSYFILFLSFVMVIGGPLFVKLFRNNTFQQLNVVAFNPNPNFKYRTQILVDPESYLIADPLELISVDLSGERRWSRPLASQNYGGALSSDYMLFYEKKAGDLFLLNTHGEILKTKMAMGEVEDARLWSNGTMGILQDRTLSILNTDLEKTTHLVIPEGHILDFHFTPSRNTYVATVIDLSRQNFNTKVIFYTSAGHIKSGRHFYNEIAYGLHYNENEIILVTDENIHFFDYQGTKKYSVSLDKRVKNFIYSPHYDEIIVLVEDENQVEFIIRYDLMGRQVFTFENPFPDPKGMAAMREHLILFNDDKWVFMNHSGVITETYRAKDRIHGIHVADHRHFAVSYINRIDFYQQR